MARYAIDSSQSRVLVVARSSVHDTETVFTGVTGAVDADVGRLVEDGASAEVAVDMTTADAGGWLENRKLRKDLDLGAHPRASFRLAALEDVRREGDRFSARARGTLSWRGREVEIEASGEGTVTESAIDAVARFELDVTRLGVTPPRFLMLKVEDVVAIEVRLRAASA